MAMRGVDFKWYDGFFLSMLATSVIIVSINWKRYRLCAHPLHIWIVVDYTTVVCAVLCVYERETKLAVFSSSTVMQTLGAKFDCYSFLPSVDMYTGWNCFSLEKGSVVQIDNICFLNHSVSGLVTTNDGSKWMISTVYGPQLDADKILFLEELGLLRASCQQPWLFLGDYNLIFDATDKNNNNLNRRMMGRFRRLLDDIELKDIYLNGRRYTWSNERDYPSLDVERLDRAICSVDWEDMYPDYFLQSFATTMSDHCTLLLSTSTSLGSAKRFRFESFWPKMDGFQQAVAEVWDKGQLPSDPMLRLFQNLKLTVKKLQNWSDSKGGKY